MRSGTSRGTSEHLVDARRLLTTCCHCNMEKSRGNVSLPLFIQGNDWETHPFSVMACFIFMQLHTFIPWNSYIQQHASTEKGVEGKYVNQTHLSDTWCIKRYILDFKQTTSSLHFMLHFESLSRERFIQKSSYGWKYQSPSTAQDSFLGTHNAAGKPCRLGDGPQEA